VLKKAKLIHYFCYQVFISFKHLIGNKLQPRIDAGYFSLYCNEITVGKGAIASLSSMFSFAISGREQLFQKYFQTIYFPKFWNFVVKW